VGPNGHAELTQVVGSGRAPRLPNKFNRGHLDHLALGAASPESFDELRRRLVERQATDGTVEDLGAFHSVWFQDPDGMHVELTLIVDNTLAGIHAPRRLEHYR